MIAPLFHYYGGKHRLSGRYPAPEHGVILEPFAGSAGYSHRYADRKCILLEVYPVLVRLWRFLIEATPARILDIPITDTVVGWPDSPERDLVGFWLNAGVARPCNVLSAGKKKLREKGDHGELIGWSVAARARVAAGVSAIKHWEVHEASVFDWDPTERYTYFVDPPYARAGKSYIHRFNQYERLRAWCLQAREHGQAIVCEAVDATWLPFRPLTTQTSIGGRTSAEGIWP